ncbi:hypothetical protein HQ531_13780 [bacterium]|nr:hypothetical protein [bacterium]
MSRKLSFFIILILLFGCDQASDPIESEPPFPPSNLQLEQLSPTSIRLSWVDNSEDEDGFRVDRKIGTGLWSEVYALVPWNSTEWLDTLAIPEEENSYKLYAYKGTVNSTSIENSIIPIYPEIVAPNPPSDLQLEQVELTNISLTWIDNSDDEEGFRIDRRIGSAAWTEVYAIVSNDNTYWLDTAAVPEEEHNYRVYSFIDTAYSIYVENSIIPLYPNPTISLTGPEQTVSVGEVFVMSVQIQDFRTPFFAISMRFSYDSSRVSFQPAETAWIGDVWSGNAIGITEMEDGLIYSSITQIAGDDLVEDNGELLSINFVGDETGEAVFEIQSDELFFYDEDGAQIIIDDLTIHSDSISVE